MRVLVCLALALAASGCVSRPGFLGPEAEPQSVYGSFLAVRYANANRDIDDSARLYSEALAFEPGSSFLSERAFISALMAGDAGRADAAAPAALASEDAPRLTWLYIKAARLAGTDIAAASPSRGGRDAFSALIEDMLDGWMMMADRQALAAERSATAMETPFGSIGYVLVHRALMHEAAGSHGEAEAAYRAALRAINLDDFTTVLLGEFLERQGRSAEAGNLYRQRLSQSGSVTDPEVAAALNRVEAGRPAPRMPSARTAAARALYAPSALLVAQAPVDYAALYLRLVQRLDPDFDRNTFALAELMEELELNESARRLYAGVDDGPWAARASINAAWLTYRTGDQSGAITLARQAVARDGSATARLLLADMLRTSSDCSAALPIYMAASQERPDDYRPLFFAGICAQLTSGWSAAEPLYLQALEIAPSEPQVLNHVGYNWIVIGNRIQEGFDLVARAAALAPDNGSVLDSLGWGHFRQGRVDEAVHWLEQAAALSPGNATINWHLGDAYAAVGRNLEARFQWRRALELNPEPRLDAVLQRRLELGLAAGPDDIE